MKRFIVAMALFICSCSAFSDDYIGMNVMTSSGNRGGSGAVVVGAEAVGKNRVKVYFVEYSIDFSSNEIKPDAFDSGLFRHRVSILNCKEKTYSSFPVDKLYDLSQVDLSYHTQGASKKWGDYDSDDDGGLFVQHTDEKAKLTKIFNLMCDSALS